MSKLTVPWFLLPFTLPSPLPQLFWDLQTKWKHWLTLALNSAPAPSGHCHVICLHHNQAHSVTPTLLITKTRKRKQNRSLPSRVYEIRPARSPRACLISLPLPSLLGNKLRRILNHKHSNQDQANLSGISKDRREEACDRQGPCSTGTTLSMHLLFPIGHTASCWGHHQHPETLDFILLFLFWVVEEE